MTSRHRPKASGLAGLGGLRDSLRAAQDQAALQARQQVDSQAQHKTREDAEREMFARAVGPVQRIAHQPLAATGRPRPSAHPRQRERDEQAAARSAMSDEVDAESLLLTDAGLSFLRPGVGADVPAKLRRGHWALQAQVDLHGLTRDQARDRLAEFVRESQRRGLRCIRVVHGKGLGSPGRQPVLKAKVQRWLTQRAEVLAFAQAGAAQGGAGALLVLLVG